MTTLVDALVPDELWRLVEPLLPVPPRPPYGGRLAKRFPNAVMVHTPTHASWLNQAEIYFSVVQRKVVAPNDFTHLDQVRQRLADFQQRYNATARPFGWRVASADLDDLLARIDRHQQLTTAPTIPHAA